MFGFPDNILGEHIERAYQALALNETRADFVRTSIIHGSFILRQCLLGLLQIRSDGRRTAEETGLETSELLVKFAIHTMLTGLDNKVLVHRCVENDSECDGTMAHCAILTGCHSDVRNIYRSN